MIALLAGLALAGGAQYGLDGSLGVVEAGTPDFDLGRIRGHGGGWDLTYRQRWFHDTGAVPWAVAEGGFAGAIRPRGTFDGEPYPGWDGDKAWTYLRFDSAARVRLHVFQAGPVVIAPTLGVAQALPVWTWDPDLTAIDPARWGVADADSVHESWHLSMFGDAYGPTLGAFVRAGPIAVDAHADLLFGPFLGLVAAPGSFGYIDGSVRGGVGNLAHTVRYARFGAQVYRPGVLEPFVRIESQSYRAKVSDGAEATSTPLRVRGASVFVGIGLHSKVPLDVVAAAPSAPLLRAARSGNLARVQALLADGADPNAVDALEGTPLAIAAEGGFLPIVDALLAAGANPELPATDNGRTPLMAAASAGQVDALQRLIAAGVNLDRPDTNGGYTALMHACYWGKPLAVQALLDAGADPSLRTSVGYDCAAAADAGFGSPNDIAGVKVVLAVHGL